MPLLSVVKNYADNTILTQQQLNQAFESIETFVNNTKIDSQNIQPSGVETVNLAASAVTADKILDATITLDKLATEIANRLVPTGTIISSGASVVPQGYLYCDGTAVSRTVFSPLFNAIGTAYGNGDGSTSFNVPDFRGFFLRGQSDGTGNDPDAASRIALSGGNAGDLLGSYQQDEMRVHDHGLTNHAHGGGSHTHTDAGHNHDIEREIVGAGANNAISNGAITSASAIQNIAGINVTAQANIQPTGGFITPQGGPEGLSSETRPRNKYVRFYIKM